MNSEDRYIHLNAVISQDMLEKMYSLINQVIQSSLNPALHWQADYVKFRSTNS